MFSWPWRRSPKDIDWLLLAWDDASVEETRELRLTIAVSLDASTETDGRGVFRTQSNIYLGVSFFNKVAILRFILSITLLFYLKLIFYLEKRRSIQKTSIKSTAQSLMIENISDRVRSFAFWKVENLISATTSKSNHFK